MPDNTRLEPDEALCASLLSPKPLDRYDIVRRRFHGDRGKTPVASESEMG